MEVGNLFDLNAFGSVIKSQWLATKDVSGLKLRGKSYLKNRVKIQAEEPLFKLTAIDLFATDDRYDHVLSHPENRIAKDLKDNRENPFVFAVNFQVPGPPFYSFVAYFTCDQETLFGYKSDSSVDEEEKKSDTDGEEVNEKGFRGSQEKELRKQQSIPLQVRKAAFEDLCTKFFLGEDDTFRDDRFKIIPKIVKGPMLVKAAVPSNKPAVLGRRLKQRYFRGPGYLELCIDIGSNTIARNVTKISVGASKHLVVDIFIALEAKEINELPERLLGIFRAVKLDLSKAVRLEKK
mmetsp:Transcript_13871/g.16825  ORF Transcript_13871/g.16825 Transcript_13871/m.16825 type:complete len:292 (+) Transcript_13871:430-1305(+)